MPQSWSIVILCFNEIDTIEQIIASAQKIAHQISPKEHEIIVVDDGSLDGSADIIKTLAQKQEKLKAIIHPSNKGIGWGLYHAYQTATMDNVVFIPADGQFDVDELSPYLTVPQNTILSFYREENLVYSFFRNILSFINKKLNVFFLGVDMKDVNWVKVYKTKDLKTLDLQLRSSLIESEICAKLFAKGYSLQEVKSVYHARQGGQSKGSSVKVVWQATKEIIKLIFIIKQFKRKINHESLRTIKHIKENFNE